MKYLLPLITSVAFLAGCATDPQTGQQSLDPGIRNAMLDVARSALVGLESSYATTGKFDPTAMAQGALGQVYTVETTNAVNGAISRVVKDPGYAGALTQAVNSVAAAGAAKGLDDKSAVLIGASLLDNLLQA